MISKIKLCFKHAGRVDGRKTIIFKPGLNIIAGPNGSGKSSLLEAIYNCRECRVDTPNKTEFHYFNSELMNPHKSEDNFKGPIGSLIKVRAMFSSHGETMRDVLRFMPLKKDGCLLLDELESGHDLKWIIKIRRGLDALANNGFQIIAATHHPVFWKNANLIELKKNYTQRTLEIYRKNF